MNVSIYDDSTNDSCDRLGNCTGYQDYDRDESFGVYFLKELVPVALVYGVTLVVGLVGNLLIVYTVVSFRRMRTISNVFLASLATADLLVVCVCVPVKFIKLFSYSWTLGEFCCKFVHYFQNVSAICSVLTLTSMSVERYYAIMHPVKSRYQCTMSQARRVIIIIWLASFITAIPIIFAQIHLEVGERYRAYWCVRNWHQPWLWRAYELYMLLLLLVAPSMVMGFAYCSICHQLWVVVKDRASMSCGEMPGTDIPLKEIHPRNQFATNNKSPLRPKSKPALQKIESDNNTVKQVIKMLVAVVVLFIICWAPILISNVLTSFDVLDRLNYGYLKPMRTAFHLLSYFNSCINPCVYGFLSANFRSSFKTALASLLCRKRQKIQGDRGLSRTGTTLISYARSNYII
ncbi:hypothetical protein JTE90_008778 [Oedothorax gibbosus]|uniref:G-protein coupled receptors family 1 profile domain-containing protein n=1 Tax=Oedothorax gibbosus TaxID=931172 RepID=A0AAV6V752_9ARAC|nr:hypothetical protein JTE90_008778 [Oedothorax gibbosus]